MTAMIGIASLACTVFFVPMALLAYKHPKGYKKIAGPLRFGFATGGTTYLLVQLALLAGLINSISDDAEHTKNQAVSVSVKSVAAIQESLNHFIFVLVLLVVLELFLTFFWHLPKILELEEKP